MQMELSKWLILVLLKTSTLLTTTAGRRVTPTWSSLWGGCPQRALEMGCSLRKVTWYVQSCWNRYCSLTPKISQAMKNWVGGWKFYYGTEGGQQRVRVLTMCQYGCNTRYILTISLSYWYTRMTTALKSGNKCMWKYWVGLISSQVVDKLNQEKKVYK